MPLRRPQILWILAAINGLLFAIVALSLEKMTTVDQQVYGLMAGMASPFATGFWNLCTLLGNWIVLVILCFTMVFCLPLKEYRAPLLLNMMLSVLLNLTLKSFFARYRPTEVTLMVVEAGYSFPSGHTMAAACFFGFLILLTQRCGLSKAIKWLLSALLALVILLVGASRIYLGAHFFSDVMGGLLCSAAYLCIFSAFIERFFGEEDRTFLPPLPHRNRFMASFSFAFEGIAASLKAERNMVVHLGIMTLVVVFAALLGLTMVEWMICILLFAMVLMAELINTAIETLVDMVSPQVDPRAKLAKDTAAGAVLVVSIASAIIGALIFVPKLLAVIGSGLTIHGAL